jgi:hypothetical protein
MKNNRPSYEERDKMRNHYQMRRKNQRRRSGGAAGVATAAAATTVKITHPRGRRRGEQAVHAIVEGGAPQKCISGGSIYIHDGCNRGGARVERREER